MRTIRRCGVFTLLAALACSVTAVAAQKPDKDTRDKESKGGDKPRLVVKAQPNIGISPARIVFSAELVGGADDFEEFYCASVEWDWGDGTTSESTSDCEPYEEKRSTIRRRFTVEHRFNQAGNYKVYFKLKRRDKIVAAAATNVQVRPGARDFD